MPGKRKRRKANPPLPHFSAAPWNPRTITPEALAALTASLRIFGDLSGFVLNDRTGTVICGHQRRQASPEVDLSAAELGKRHKVELGHEGDRFISVERTGFVTSATGARFSVRVVNWPDAFERAANVAANSPELQGDFQPDELATLLESLAASEPDLYEDLRFAKLAGELTGARLVNFQVPDPPPVTWVLVGIPTVRFGEIAELVEGVAAIDGTLCETIASNQGAPEA